MNAGNPQSSENRIAKCCPARVHGHDRVGGFRLFDSHRKISGPLEVKMIEVSRPKETSWNEEPSTRWESKARRARKKLRPLRLRLCPSSSLIEGALQLGGTASDLIADAPIAAGIGTKVLFIWTICF